MTTCSYDCSTVKKKWQPDPDITGLGVVIGYSATAFIAVFILAAYFIMAHQPKLDPFRDKNGNPPPSSERAVPYKPNPIDELALGLLSKIWERRRRVLEHPQVKNSQLERALTKCVLNMGDIQIVTGISLLVTGYSQLRCGLSVYDWQVLVLLVFFSSVTHLACLSFLRNYLYIRRPQRLLRVIWMSIMAIMLVVAMVPTANTDILSWIDAVGPVDYDNPNLSPAAYAICNFRKPLDTTSESYPSVVVSVFLIVFGLSSRFFRLYKILSVNLVGRLRRFMSDKAQFVLRRVYEWAEVESSPIGLRRMLVFRPLLATFVSARVLVDAYGSMLIEVCWLLVCFTWAIAHLVVLLRERGVFIQTDWTFGQILPMILLAAPLLTFSSFLQPFEEREDQEKCGNGNGFRIRPYRYQSAELQRSPSPSSLITETFQPSNSRREVQQGAVDDTPEQKFYRDSSWAPNFVFFVLFQLFSLSLGALDMVALGGHATSLFNLFEAEHANIKFTWLISWPPVATILCQYYFILFQLDIESIRAQWPRQRAAYRACSLLNFLCFASMTAWCTLPFLWIVNPDPNDASLRPEAVVVACPYGIYLLVHLILRVSRFMYIKTTVLEKA
ncbi:hypothetical protein NA57DRAFT_53976 [Rhizodiscina lignyota]|uniref:Transmembrane protein n=1 Tax=Rhizodiscina lignyota TaxID=1504668 RepID=A0A9P4MC41_9PEZI|nr:hypothetical protein NA57DRAFT_53976 [Rhizodiscina lignyota]